MSLKANQVFTCQLHVHSAAGPLVNADALPVATLIRNGVDLVDVVTVTNVTTGRYRASGTVPAAAVVGDVIQVRVEFAVGGTQTADLIFGGTIDHDIAAGTEMTLTSGERTGISDSLTTKLDAQGLTSTRAAKLDRLPAVGTVAIAGDAMTLTSGERQEIADGWAVEFDAQGYTIGRATKLDRLPGSGTVAVGGEAMTLTGPTISSIQSGLATAASLAAMGVIVDSIDIGVAGIDAKTSLLAFTSGHVHARVQSHSSGALAEFATINTGETSAATGSVAKLSQGAAGGSGGAGASVADLLPYFRAIARSDASDVDIDGTFNPATDSLEALRTRIDSVGGQVPAYHLPSQRIVYGEGEIVPRTINLFTTEYDGQTVTVRIDAGNSTSRQVLQSGVTAVVATGGLVPFTNVAGVTTKAGYAQYDVWLGTKRIGTGPVQVLFAARASG
jgi:hypothetical protein